MRWRLFTSRICLTKGFPVSTQVDIKLKLQPSFNVYSLYENRLYCSVEDWSIFNVEIPTSFQRQIFNVESTLKQRHDEISTKLQRWIDVACPLGNYFEMSCAENWRLAFSGKFQQTTYWWHVYFFPENILTFGNKLHEMSNPVSWEKYQNISKCLLKIQHTIFWNIFLIFPRKQKPVFFW